MALRTAQHALTELFPTGSPECHRSCAAQGRVPGADVVLSFIAQGLVPCDAGGRTAERLKERALCVCDKREVSSYFCTCFPLF